MICRFGFWFDISFVVFLAFKCFFVFMFIFIRSIVNFRIKISSSRMQCIHRVHKYLFFLFFSSDQVHVFFATFGICWLSMEWIFGAIFVTFTLSSDQVPVQVKPVQRPNQRCAIQTFLHSAHCWPSIFFCHIEIVTIWSSFRNIHLSCNK